jgi:hypothetical protein
MDRISDTQVCDALARAEALKDTLFGASAYDRIFECIRDLAAIVRYYRDKGIING